MQVIPLRSVPNQTLQVQLDGQPATLQVVQYAYGLFLSVYLNGELVVASVICRNATRIIRSLYLGFSGDFVFLDMQGTADPVYTGLGGPLARYQLLYLEPSELPAGEG
jgi:hypothetical protein